MELKGSKTEKNLLEAFAGESQARNKYTYFSSAAKKEGYEQISAIFQETADNEKEHAKIWFKLLNGIGTTTENLKTAASGEHYEWTSMYRKFAEEARAEGFANISMLFDKVAQVEKEHEARYLALNENIKNETVFKKDSKTYWKCRNCGHIHEGAFAPELCPVCSHPRAYFELKAQNW